MCVMRAAFSINSLVHFIPHISRHDENAFTSIDFHFSSTHLYHISLSFILLSLSVSLELDHICSATWGNFIHSIFLCCIRSSNLINSDFLCWCCDCLCQQKKMKLILTDELRNFLMTKKLRQIKSKSICAWLEIELANFALQIKSI